MRHPRAGADAKKLQRAVARSSTRPAGPSPPAARRGPQVSRSAAPMSATPSRSRARALRVRSATCRIDVDTGALIQPRSAVDARSSCSQPPWKTACRCAFPRRVGGVRRGDHGEDRGAHRVATLAEPVIAQRAERHRIDRKAATRPGSRRCHRGCRRGCARRCGPDDGSR